VRPIVAVEGDERIFQAERARLARAGWRVVAGFNAVDESSEHHAVVRAGPVMTSRTASDVVLAVLAGDGVLIHALAARDVLDRLYEDLQHLGGFIIRTTENRNAQPASLSPQEQQLIRLLLSGHSLASAAATMSISPRTADRRLAAARHFYGVHSTAQVLRAAAADLDPA
jgi:DNA-binding CsgD family transcriptional regulator